jgi:hypothetical protein
MDPAGLTGELKMYPIRFSKTRAEELISAIGEGRQIPAPANGWNCDEMLQAAGGLYFAALSHGPQTTDKNPNTKIPGENGNTATHALNQDLHMAIDFYSDLTMMVCGGSYDERFESELQAVVLQDGEDRAFKIIDGAKKSQ